MILADMRKYTVLIAFIYLAFASNFSYAGWVRITGKITNPLAENIEVVRVTNYVNDQEKIYTSKVGANGEFTLDMEVFAPQYIQIKHSIFKTRAFAAPGNDFNINFDCVDFQKSIKYSGKGGADNNFMAEYFRKYESNTAWDVYLLMCKSHDPMKFKQVWMDHLKEEEEFLKNYAASFPLTDAFKVWMADHIRYKNANQLWDYQFNHAWENDIEVSSFTPPPSYFTFLDDFKANNDYLASSPYYNRFLDNFIWHLYNLDLSARDMEGFERFDVRAKKEIALTKKNFTGYARDKQYSDIMYEILEKNEKDLFESLYDDYKGIVEDEHLKFVIEVKSNQVIAKNKGEALPLGAKEIQVVDENGNTVPFKDLISLYAGNVVYVDFWASWCAPCIQEMPSSLILQDRFQGEPVKFLYLSQDEESDRWRKAIARNSITGDHVLMNREMFVKLSGQYNVSSIPRYMIIDKNGNVVVPDATSPSNINTAKKINELLEQQ